MATHIPLSTPLYLATIGTLIGVYEACDNAMYGQQHRNSRHELYKLQLIEKNAVSRPVVTEKGRAYLVKLKDASSTITLTPRERVIEWA